MGARIRKLAVFLGCFCRRLRRGCQLPRRRLSEMAAGDSRSEALEWQPRFLRPKEVRHGTESRRVVPPARIARFSVLRMAAISRPYWARLMRPAARVGRRPAANSASFA